MGGWLGGVVIGLFVVVGLELVKAGKGSKWVHNVLRYSLGVVVRLRP